MRILIVSGSYYPTKSPRSFRSTELARELSRQGNEVTVLIPPSDLDIAEELRIHGVVIKFMAAKRKRNFKCDGVFGGFKSKINRALEWLFEYPANETVGIVDKALKSLLPKKYDLLISIAYPHMNHWGCNRFLKSHSDFCKSWIADCGDPYMGATMQKVSPPFWFASTEKSWCRRVNHITVPIEGAKDGYYKEFRNKIVVIPQGFRMDIIDLPPYKQNAIPTFAYSGGVGMGQRNPLAIIEELEQMGDDYHAVFYTNWPSFYSRYTNNPHIELREYVEREQLLPELAKMDFLLNLDNGTTRQLPSKLIDYAITGRPILNLNALSLNRDILKEFISGNYEHKMAVSPKEEYDIINIAKRFISLAIE